MSTALFRSFMCIFICFFYILIFPFPFSVELSKIKVTDLIREDAAEL